MEHHESRESIHEHLRELELRLLQPEVRQSAEVAELLADDFVEYGSSGGVADKKSTLEGLKRERGSARYEAEDFSFVDLAPDTVQIRYRTRTEDTKTRARTEALRSSIWKLVDGKWRMVFHQGTRTASR